MPVPVVKVRIVRMRVAMPGVRVTVRMRLARQGPRVVSVLMVHIVSVQVFVLERLVHVLVLVVFAHV